MKRAVALFPVFAALLLAGCQDAPITAPEAPLLSTSSPTAVITNWHQKPMPSVNGQLMMRFEFHGLNSSGSGGITEYYWYPDTKCRFDPQYGAYYYMDIPEGVSCGLTLRVKDGAGGTGWTTQYYSW
jgi:hypothetical protein